jgi:DNA-binding transcriptional MerR regulator
MKNESNISEQARQALVKIRERKFGLKDLGVSSRVISNWKQQGLLMEGMISEDRKGKKLNLTEWVWFKMIVELREIGIPLKRIRDFGEWLKSDTVKLNNLIVMDNGDRRLDKLEFLILFSLVGRIPVYFLFFSSESQAPFTVYIPGDNIQGYAELKAFYDEYEKMEITKISLHLVNHQTHVSVSLLNILKGFITEKQYESFVKGCSLLTDNEIELLQYLRKGNLKEARIKFNENYEISLLELTEFRTNVEKEARLMDYMKTGGYQNITYVTENGRIVKFENTIKVKFNKK